MNTSTQNERKRLHPTSIRLTDVDRKIARALMRDLDLGLSDVVREALRRMAVDYGLFATRYGLENLPEQPSRIPNGAEGGSMLS